MLVYVGKPSSTESSMALLALIKACFGCCFRYFRLKDCTEMREISNMRSLIYDQL